MKREVLLQKTHALRSYYKTHDQALGIYNRASLETHLRKYHLMRATGYILVINVKHIEDINTAYGYLYGEELLKGLASFLRGTLKLTPYLFTGSALVIILDGFSYKHAKETISHIMERFRKPWKILDKECSRFFSLGLLELDPNAVDEIDILRSIEFTLMGTSVNSRNGFYEFSKDRKKTAIARVELENDLHDMVENGCKELCLQYQPIYNIQENIWSHVEALVRWRHPTRGDIPPTQFISLAEDTGLIHQLGEYVLMTACKQCQLWRKDGLDWLILNVNISSLQIVQYGFVEIVSNALQRSGLPPENLVLELTENIDISEFEDALPSILRLNAMGVKLAMDDLGTGFSSLSNLKKFPLYLVKIDKCFVSQACESEYDQSVIYFATQIAKFRGMQVCAEGVETKEQYELMNHLGVSYVQGFLLSKPVNANQIPGIVKLRPKIV